MQTVILPLWLYIVIIVLTLSFAYSWLKSIDNEKNEVETEELLNEIIAAYHELKTAQKQYECAGNRYTNAALYRLKAAEERYCALIGEYREKFKRE